MQPQEFSSYLHQNYQSICEQIHTQKYKLEEPEQILTVDKKSLPKLLKKLMKDDKLRFKMLMSICGNDYLNREKRFEIIYTLLSIESNIRLIVKVNVTEGEPVPSVTSIFSCANWYEREVFDMYGIMFAGNDDLRRILTDYGFEGHPLRKDFPLTGFYEVKYDIVNKSVTPQPVDLQQDYRSFDFASAWSGDGKLPGDEKRGFSEASSNSSIQTQADPRVQEIEK